MNMIKLNIETTPHGANYLLNALAAGQNELALIAQQVAEQGNAQVQPPAPESEPEVLDKE